MLSDEKMDGYIFGRLIKGTLARSNGKQTTLEFSELVKSTGLPRERVQVGCRRLEGRGFIRVTRSSVALTAFGRNIVRSRFENP